MVKESKTTDPNPNTVEMTRTPIDYNVSTNKFTFNPSNNITLDTTEKNKEEKASSDFKRLVEKYMLCDKRTLAEMLAMKDMDKKEEKLGNTDNDYLQKLLESPDTWRIHPEPVNPYPYQDYGDFCFNAPNNKCIRGGGAFKSCLGCPYYNGIVYTRTDGTSDKNCNCSYSTTWDCTHPGLIGKNNKQRLDD